MRKARGANLGESGGQDGQIIIGGKVSKSRVVQGDNLKVDTAKKGEELPIGSEVTLISSARLTIVDSNLTIVGPDGQPKQQHLHGEWDFQRKDDQERRIYKRIK